MESKKKFKYQKRYNLDDPKDAEEMLRIFESLEEDDDLAQQIDQASELKLVLHYPRDGNDSDKVDAVSDEEDLLNIKFDFIGRRVLSEGMDMRVVKKNSLQIERSELFIPENSSKRVKTVENTTSRMEEQAGPSNSGPLTENDKNVPNLLQDKKSAKKKTRAWHEETLIKGSANNIFSTNPEPEVISEWKANEYKPKRRCGKCGKCTKFRCIKCNVGLHPDGCFVKYHTT